MNTNKRQERHATKMMVDIIVSLRRCDAALVVSVESKDADNREMPSIKPDFTSI